MNKTVFISADHGLSIVYFLQSDLVKHLLDAGVRVVLLTDDALVGKIRERFGQDGLIIEGLRLKEANHYYTTVKPTEQWWLNYLRRVGGSSKMNTEAMDSNVQQVEFEATGKRRAVMPFMRLAVALLRQSNGLRKRLIRRQMKFVPGLYAHLFDKYQPDLVMASTLGWRLDRYLLREAAQRGVQTMGMIVGWDNPSSYAIPGAPMNWVNCWSEKQKDELMTGSDWPETAIHIGGIPSYDGYFRQIWQMDRDAYFKLHGLDPERKLLSFACSFITFSPNYQDIEAIAELVAADELAQPSQLIIRLHPNHFMDEPLFSGEREKIRALARRLPHVHVIEPVALGGDLGYYSGEDMPEKSSMMAHSDVFMTVYSTMVVEEAIHDRPILSVCIDSPGGWNQPGKFSLALSEIGEWPTHQRFIQAGAGKVAKDKAQLKALINECLLSPEKDSAARRRFIEQETTFTDGSAGRRTAEFVLSVLSGEREGDERRE